MTIQLFGGGKAQQVRVGETETYLGIVTAVVKFGRRVTGGGRVAGGTEVVVVFGTGAGLAEVLLGGGLLGRFGDRVVGRMMFFLEQVLHAS